MKRLISESIGDHDTGMRHFHVDDKLTDATILSGDYPDDCASERDLQLLRSLMDLPGVTQIYLKKYELSVIIGDAFRWADVEPKVRAVLEDFFRPEVYTFERRDRAWGTWDDYDEDGPRGEYRPRCPDHFESYEVVPVARQLEGGR